MGTEDLGEESFTVQDLMDRLAACVDHEFRIALADRSDTPLEVLLVLIEDEHPDVRYAIAENHNVDEALLRRLIEDCNPYVAHRAQRTLARIGHEIQSSA